jgi:hypothetical protein
MRRSDAWRSSVTSGRALSGVIRYKWTGAPGEKVMDAALDKLIEAAKGNGKKTPR